MGPVARRLAALVRDRRLLEDPCQAAAAGRLDAVYRRAVASRRGLKRPVPLRRMGLYLHGGVGVGKSLLMDTLAEHVREELRVPVRRAHFHEFMLGVHGRMHELRQRGAESQGHGRSLQQEREKQERGQWQLQLQGKLRALVPWPFRLLLPPADPLWGIGKEIATAAPLLCLDEFQVTDVADAMVLRRLFSSIWHHGGTLVATSNRAPDRLYERGLNRQQFLPFIDLLQKNCEVYELQASNGVDYRHRFNSGSLSAGLEVVAPDRAPARPKKTFWPLSADPTKRTRQHEEIMRAFEALAGFPENIHPEVLETGAKRGSRGLRVPFSTDEGVGMVYFEDICGDRVGSSPHGASDFLALANRYHTLFILDMPTLSLDPGAAKAPVTPLAEDDAPRPSPNKTRRFVTLLDALYERRTRLVVASFAGSLESLFDGSSDVVSSQQPNGEEAGGLDMTVVDEGGSSGRLTTMIGEMEWSATGIIGASLANAAGAADGETRFALQRVYSRLVEMQSTDYWNRREGGEGGEGGLEATSANASSPR